MKLIKKKKLKKLMVATIAVCFIGTQVSAMADCASDENNCETDAGNGYNDQVATDANVYDLQEAACYLLIWPPAIDSCEITNAITYANALDAAGEQYDNTISQCQRIYQQCIGG